MVVSAEKCGEKQEMGDLLGMGREERENEPRFQAWGDEEMIVPSVSMGTPAEKGRRGQLSKCGAVECPHRDIQQGVEYPSLEPGRDEEPNP